MFIFNRGSRANRALSGMNRKSVGGNFYFNEILIFLGKKGKMGSTKANV
jgi:hypothetical protein